MRNFEWWSRVLWRIRPNIKARGYVPFILNPIQAKVWQAAKRKNVVPKPRRIGLSTLGISRVAHRTLTESNLDSLVVGNEKKVAMNLLNMLNRGYSAMPETVTIECEGEQFEFPCKPELKHGESKLSFVCVHDFRKKHPKNISTVEIATAKGEYAVGRSVGIGMLLMTEAGMPEYWDGEAAYSASQGLPEDETGEVWHEGSPYGAQGWFHSIVQDAKNHRNDYVYHWHTWLEHPAYVRKPGPQDVLEPTCKEEYELVHKYGASIEQMLWARYKVQNYFRGGKGDPWKLFGQEYPVDEYKCWLRQGRGYFSAEMIEWGMERAIAQFKILEAAGRVYRYSLLPKRFGNPELADSPSGPWTFIEKPVPGYPYLLTGDPAEGLDDSNHSAAIIWKPSSLGPHRAIGYLNQVISIEEFEANEYAAGILFNRAMVMNESNNGGIAVNSLLARDGYPNLYRMPHSAKGELTGKHEHRYGFWSGDTSKKVALTTLTRGLNDAYTSGGSASRPWIFPCRKCGTN